MDKPTVICLTPVKNEAWILDRFLQSASLWADRIIVLDQMSTDGSPEIAKRYPKVTLLHNPSPIYNEVERQKMLLEEARRIPGPRLLIALDADEALTANFTTSPEWQTVLTAPIGTVIHFKWVNFLSDLEHYWTSPYDYAFGFMDDDSDHTGSLIHSSRIPIPAGAPTYVLHDVKAIHYQFADWDRQESKTRWYQCWEKLNHPQRRAVEIYRQYHRAHIVSDEQIHPIPDRWLQGYYEHGIDMTSILRIGRPWWDWQVLDLIDKYGANHFRRENIWWVDWAGVYRERYGKEPANSMCDPRSYFDKLIHYWLQKTQPYCHKLLIRTLDQILKLFGW
ncbi:glycosyltransferase family 2 protein [Nostoc sp.]|uniref:glycosyltransferase family 2 protein n=1 Tax=Nostoc sp. TaxID=1180 RepID=UPI002FF7DFCF